MRRMLLPLLLLTLVALAVAQDKAPNFVVGTIVAAVPHQPPPADPDIHLYDVSVQVGDSVYVVLYDPHPDSTIATYREGAQVMVAVGKDTLTFNDILGRHRAFAILKVTPAPKKD